MDDSARDATDFIHFRPAIIQPHNEFLIVIVPTAFRAIFISHQNAIGIFLVEEPRMGSPQQDQKLRVSGDIHFSRAIR